MEKKALQVLGIGGSLRPYSRSLSALRFALHACELEGVDTKLLDIAHLNLPLYQPGKNMFDHDGVKSFAESVANCDVIFVSSPVYAGNISGSVKNTLDFIHDMEHTPSRLNGRVAGIMAISEGTQCATCLAALYSTLSAMGACVVPSRVGLTSDAFDKEGNLWDPIAADRIVALVYDALNLARRQQTTLSLLDKDKQS